MRGARSIEIEGLSKRYRLGTGFARYASVREAITSAVLRRGESGDRAEVWALRDINLTVDEGETVGVIGRNGAGKTTLLKVLSRITEPTAGVARTRGRVGALLEVGAGFHPELTGRDNIFLNGAVLGMPRRETARRFDEIVSFAQVEPFLDTPLKRYSSGMYLRLAFSVAAHLAPEIVMVDEVLAVGDVEFRHRCMQKMADLHHAGRTVLFVSHDLGAVARICSRVVWIDGGRIRMDSSAEEAINAYVAPAEADRAEARVTARPHAPVQDVSVAIVDGAGSPILQPRRDKPLSLRMRFALREPVPYLDVGVYLIDSHGTRVINDARSDAHPDPLFPDAGEYEAVVTIPPMLTPGDYLFGVWMGTTAGEEFVDEEALSFRLLPRHDDRQEWVERPRVVQPQLDWRVEKGPM
jgi:ABC-type polysaccharide/polyol phosphate transport system ATPase subunit